GQIVVAGNRLFKALLAVDGRGGADSALQFDDLALFGADGIDQPLAGDAAFLDLVGGDGGEIEIFGGIDATVEQDDGDLGFLGFGQDLIPASGDDRRHEDGIDTLGDEAADGLDLVFLLLLGVGEFEIDAAGLGFLLGYRGFSGAPAGLRADLRKADDFSRNVLGEGYGRQSCSEARREGELGHDIHDVPPK